MDELTHKKLMKAAVNNAKGLYKAKFKVVWAGMTTDELKEIMATPFFKDKVNDFYNKKKNDAEFIESLKEDEFRQRIINLERIVKNMVEEQEYVDAPTIVKRLQILEKNVINIWKWINEERANGR